MPYWPLGLALPCRPLQPVQHVGLCYLLDVWIVRECIAIEAATEEGRQTVLVGEEPCFHALHHQMRIVVRGAVGSGPIVTSLQVPPRSGALGHGVFAVHQ